ncbi:MAG: DUF364 domain-containing protein [Hydrogenibacillus schlegelii]|nr:DUF364 domain-containing protein [Hydrogenibacillus schlegelii]
MPRPLEVYDALIDLVPPERTADDVLVGPYRTLVRSGGNIGVAITAKDGGIDIPDAGSLAGRPLRELAERVRSWNLVEASVGLAAINAALNTKENAERLTGRPLSSLPSESIFDVMRERLRGQKVAVVGHFPGLEALGEVATLTVLERRPLPGDLPDSAAEVVLPDQDVVFLTAATLVNKTFPRLVELSRNALVVLVGPSTPLAPVLFDYGVDVLAGAVVTEAAHVWRVVQEGGHFRRLHESVQRVTVMSARSRHEGVSG